MKRGFTLVELLVVVVVIAILAGIAFRLGGVANGVSARDTTITYMQRLENCISGYYAAFGSYPPVTLQGRSRNIYYRVEDEFGLVQKIEEGPHPEEGVVWDRVEAACRSQPVSVLKPFANDGNDWQTFLVAMSKTRTKMYGDPPFDGLTDTGRFTAEQRTDPTWAETQIFKFGLLSYLLPRYLIMMCYGSTGETIYDDFAQWGDNNTMPCRFEDGLQASKWADVNDRIVPKNSGKGNPEAWMIAALPSQAVTARWLPNFVLPDGTGMLTGGSGLEDVMGVQVGDGNFISVDTPLKGKLFSINGSQRYVLDYIECNDGWKNEFYYYSPPPYQNYRLWSAGPNGKTFPPWFPDEEINELREAATIRNWLSDDIVHMSN